MKTTYTSLILIAGLFCITVFSNSCAKADTSTGLPKEQQVVGEWDTVIKSTPKPKNFVRFDANGGFEYKLNSTTSDIGTYEFGSASTLVTNSLPKAYSWTMITLTDVLFTVVSKGSDPAFPGYFVERYQTFTR